ncbi:MAG: dTDP-4-dehydrorhamnose reductase [Culicoidibacterales bacterium]
MCEKVNVHGTKYLAQACQQLGIPMMYFSTDYVFSGNGEAAFEIDGEIAPTSVYGRTKWEGEEVVRQLVPEHFILRISWVFGENGNNFIKTMLRLGAERSELNVIDDQIGSPTYTADVAKLVVEMMQTSKYGTYHTSNEGFCSWAEFAKEIFAVAKLDVTVHPIPTEQYPTRAQRPKNSRISKQSLIDNGFALLPTWQEATKAYIINL